MNLGDVNRTNHGQNVLEKKKMSMERKSAEKIGTLALLPIGLTFHLQTIIQRCSGCTFTRISQAKGFVFQRGNFSSDQSTIHVSRQPFLTDEMIPCKSKRMISKNPCRCCAYTSFVSESTISIRSRYHADPSCRNRGGSTVESIAVFLSYPAVIMSNSNPL